MSNWYYEKKSVELDDDAKEKEDMLWKQLMNRPRDNAKVRREVNLMKINYVVRMDILQGTSAFAISIRRDIRMKNTRTQVLKLMSASSISRIFRTSWWKLWIQRIRRSSESFSMVVRRCQCQCRSRVGVFENINRKWSTLDTPHSKTGKQRVKVDEVIGDTLDWRRKWPLKPEHIGQGPDDICCKTGEKIGDENSPWVRSVLEIYIRNSTKKKMYTRTQKQLEHEEVQKWPMYVVFLLSIYIHIFTLHLNRRFVKLLLSGVKYVVWKHSQISTLEYIPTLENRYPRGQEILVAHMKDFLDKLNPILKVRDVSYLSHESKIKCTLERYSNTQVLDKVRYVSVCIVVFECAFRFVWDSVIQWEKKPRTRTHSSTTHVTHSNNTNTTHRIKTYQTIRINFRVVNCTSCYVFVPHRSMVTSIYYAIYSITRTTFDTQTQHRWLKAARTVRTIDLWCVLSDTIGVFSRIRLVCSLGYDSRIRFSPITGLDCVTNGSNTGTWLVVQSRVWRECSVRHEVS